MHVPDDCGTQEKCDQALTDDCDTQEKCDQALTEKWHALLCVLKDGSIHCFLGLRFWNMFAKS